MNGEPAARAIVRMNEKAQLAQIREPGNLLRLNDEISSEESNSSEPVVLPCFLKLSEEIREAFFVLRYFCAFLGKNPIKKGGCCL